MNSLTKREETALYLEQFEQLLLLNLKNKVRKKRHMYWGRGHQLQPNQ